MLSLALMPCADHVNSCFADAGIEVCDHTATDETEYPCSPLCACVCCGVLFSFSQTEILPLEEQLLGSVDVFPKQFSYTLEYRNLIWHPPSLT